MSERKTAEVKFRCTPSFKASLAAAADAADQSMSEYIEGAVWAHRNARIADEVVGGAVAAAYVPLKTREFVSTDASVANPPLTPATLNEYWRQATAPSSAVPVVASEEVPAGVVLATKCDRDCRAWEFCACKAGA